ncbi:alpha/beta fold hydrolase [Pseudorhodoplanes sp.]|uniref:alpha/beta fold hydrolase n=1 Tax=Pseudorhodoplanes sp. TaxID=1934341 RepID=UPI002CD0D2DC|nr:alpha/beta fold hydrolase [Pseudorhodoplanes sp.]HWV52089.1 alpha/beta fold hydrolase [Pseudorhodoplanes sp.]
MRFRCRLAAAVAALAMLTGPVVAQTPLRGPDGDGFYIVPPLPAKPHGSVIWARPLTGTMALPSAARNILVAYPSVDGLGGIAPVSGTIAIPQGEAPKGGWPVITWTHGTTGLNAICAPSRDTAGGPEHPYIETIRTLLDGFVKRGYAVVATDYAGLGIAGFHPFLQGVPTGRNALDMLRAAREIEPAIGKRYAVMGHSQGGQVDLFTASLGPTYVPDFKLVGNVAFAPGSHIADRLNAVMKSDKTELSLPYVLYTLWSYARSERSIDLQRILTPQAIRHLPDLYVQCMSHALSQGYWSKAIAKDQFVAKPDISIFREFAQLNEPGRLRITAPTLIIQGTGDVTVFPEATDDLARQLCARGNVVAYKPIAGADHNGSMKEGAAMAMDFIDARFAGKKAENQCKALPKAGKR